MNNESKNKIFDVVMTEALKEYMDTELKQMNELAKADTCEFSDKFKRKVRRIENSIGRADRVKKGGIVILKTLVTAAAVFGIIFGMLLTQPEVFAAVQKTIRTVFGEYDKIEYIDEATAALNDDIRLGYVPEGYYLSKGTYTPIDVVLTYTNRTDDIRLEYGFANGAVAHIDNEHSEYEQFSSDGIEYHYYKSTVDSYLDILTWDKNGYLFVLTAHLSKDELIKIAENIKI